MAMRTAYFNLSNAEQFWLLNQTGDLYLMAILKQLRILIAARSLLVSASEGKNQRRKKGMFKLRTSESLSQMSF